MTTRATYDGGSPTAEVDAGAAVLEQVKGDRGRFYSMQARKRKARDFNRGQQQEPRRKPSSVSEEMTLLVQEVESVPPVLKRQQVGVPELKRQKEVVPKSGFDDLRQELGEAMPYTTEPEELPHFSCDGLCVQRAKEGKPPLAYVVSLSACEDDQQAWEDGAGGSMTQVCFQVRLVGAEH
jgi:hypothetical protein